MLGEREHVLLRWKMNKRLMLLSGCVKEEVQYYQPPVLRGSTAQLDEGKRTVVCTLTDDFIGFSQRRNTGDYMDYSISPE